MEMKIHRLKDSFLFRNMDRLIDAQKDRQINGLINRNIDMWTGVQMDRYIDKPRENWIQRQVD